MLEYIRMAIQFKASRIHVRENSIIFEALREIAMPVHFLTHHDTYDIHFNQFRWFKIRDFIMNLQEQPLTVELLDDIINISCEACFVV